MALSLSNKLRIRNGMTLLTIHAPDNFSEKLKPLPPAVKVVTSAKSYNQIHWFVRTRKEMEKELSRVMKLMIPDVICWIYYPKGSSEIQTDLSRDKGWELLMKLENLQWLSLISFDETWSSFGMRLKTEADKKKEEAPKERVIFQYVDPKTKSVRLPADLEALLQKSKKAQAFFDELSFTNKKEYIEWIVSAKREETRKERVEGTVERLTKRWKNPRNL
jgi:Bacteriocin-protection, YdeI or OmpD-Associated